MQHHHLRCSSPSLGVLLGIGTLVATTIGTVAPAQGAQTTALPPIASYRSASCGCCKGWVQHMRANGFEVKDAVVSDIDVIRRRLGVPTRLISCHTAQVAGYFLEGHVPAADVKRLLRTRPLVLGLAVPGMVLGTPGMEAVTVAKPYSVLAFTKTGRTSLFSRYAP